METIELINLLRITEDSIMAMESELKKVRFNLILVKLRKKLSTSTKSVTPIIIIRKAGVFYDIAEDYYENKTRERLYVSTRQQAMHIIKKLFPKKSLMSIGALFGKDHATVLHAIKTVNNLIDTDKRYKKDYEDLMRYILK